MKKQKTFRNYLKSQRGMTLVEVLVAMTLVVLIIMVFTPMFMSYFRNIRTAGQVTQKTYERASLMERLVANSGGDNDEGYESAVSSIPIELKTGTTIVDFTNSAENIIGTVNGTLVSESLNDKNAYVSFYTPSSDSTMICFPANLTDDFITKDITVVPKGFKFHKDSKNKNATSGYHFEVYNTNNSGEKTKVPITYYDIRFEKDGNKGDVAIFTFKGANDVISFEHSPLWIQYCGNGGMLYQVKVEIGAPEIIMVGERASDGNYYYYATSGVDVKTGKMDIIAKKMSGAPLVSAMNDVEWVAKGRGDNGNGGVNQYGYYVMGGDAGQVRRFWRNETTGNYYWDGDVLGNYDRYLSIIGDNNKDGNSYENINQEKTTQAQFKSIFRSKQGEYDYNGVSNANQLTSDELITLGFTYKMTSSNYYTANVSQGNYKTTIGRVLSYKNGSKEYRVAGCTTENPKQAKTWNDQLYAEMLPGADGYTSKLNVNGYKTATNYEYPDDNSLITITSVGAIQINKNNNNYSESTQAGIFGNQLYPTQSYTLYCGKIPAVIDTWGWKTAQNDLIGAALNQNWSKWLHTGTLGVATDGNYWYPTGKFGDSKTTASTGTAPGKLSSSVFGNNTSWNSLLNFGADASKYPFSNTSVQEPVTYLDTSIFDCVYSHRVKYIVEIDIYYAFKGWRTEQIAVNDYQTCTTAGGTDSSYRTGEMSDGTSWGTTKRNAKIIEITSSQIYKNGQWVEDGNKNNIKIEDNMRIVEWDELGEYTVQYRMPQEKTEYINVYARYYSPVAGSGAGHVTKPSDVTNANLTTRSFMGTSLPVNGNDYYVSGGHEVDITMGYLSQPYAIDVNNPTVPAMSGFSGLTGGSDFYFKKPGQDGMGSNILSGDKFNHSFISGGLRDNVTMLDVKSFHDDLTGNNISLAAGYTLSYVANDYNYCTRLGQVLNNGVVYIRATGDGTENDTEGSLASGKGWSLKKETNVFHQFFGIDQYRSVSLSQNSGLTAISGWNTTYHKGYLNMSTDSEKAPQSGYSPSIETGNQNYGVNLHPLMDTECTTVNWGTTPDLKPQAMWGTANGTLMSWFYDYEQVKNSKIYSVRKEFENYSWCDKFGIKSKDNDAYRKQYYDDITVTTGDYTNYGFVSVLKNVNDICFADNVWVAVGDQSEKKPSDYSAPHSYDRLGGSGDAGSYVNVKFVDKDLGYARWIHVRISSQTNIHFKSVVNCQGVWYIMGYVDVNNNGIQDARDRCVIYYSKTPQDGFKRCQTRMSTDDDYTGDAITEKSYALYFDNEGTCKNIELGGINKMACQS